MTRSRVAEALSNKRKTKISKYQLFVPAHLVTVVGRASWTTTPHFIGNRTRIGPFFYFLRL
jgi:hypothetical protein